MIRTKVQNKLKGTSGATIALALLVFLVCAMVGSVVLAAGTAAAGRTSDAAEADARYYSVRSAAELLAEQINGATFTVTRTETVVTNSVSRFRVTPEVPDSIAEPLGSSTSTLPVSYTSRLKAAGLAPSPLDVDVAENPDYTSEIFIGSGTKDLSILIEAALALTFGDNLNNAGYKFNYSSAGKDPAGCFGLSYPCLDSELDRTYVMTQSVKLAGEEGDVTQPLLDSLKVRITERLLPSGALCLDVSNDAAPGEDIFVVTVLFSAALSDSTVRSDSDPETTTVYADDPVYEGKKIATVTETTTAAVARITTVTWTYMGLE